MDYRFVYGETEYPETEDTSIKTDEYILSYVNAAQGTPFDPLRTSTYWNTNIGSATFHYSVGVTL